jgi:polysaccharide biosynthesis protein PslH
MRLLFITPEPPCEPFRGYSLITAQHIRRLSARHEIDIVSFVNGEADAVRHELRTWCAEVHLIPRRRAVAVAAGLRALAMGRPFQVGYCESAAMADVVRDVVRRRRHDVAIVVMSRMAQYRPPAFDGAALLAMVDPVPLNYERSLPYRPRLLRPLYRLEARRLHLHERALQDAFDRALLISERDIADYAGALENLRFDRVGHGVDVTAFSPRPVTDREKGLIVMTGNMFYAPNVDAAMHFCRAVWPAVRARVAEARLVIVGARPTRAVQRLHNGSDVVVTGWVPDVREWLGRAAVSVCPVRLPVGTQTKVLEAMAMATPVVMTSAANRGIGAVHRKHALIADDAAEFADAVAGVLRGADAGLGVAARTFVERCFGWDRSVAQFEKVLHAVAGDAATPTHAGVVTP